MGARSSDCSRGGPGTTVRTLALRQGAGFLRSERVYTEGFQDMQNGTDDFAGIEQLVLVSQSPELRPVLAGRFWSGWSTARGGPVIP